MLVTCGQVSKYLSLVKRKILPVLLPQFTFTGGGSAKYTYICRLRLWQLIAISNLAGWTPLHVAAEGGHEAVVEVLLCHKADCSLVTDTGHDHIIMIYIDCHFF